MKQRRIAIHEAGHAVMAHYGGVKVEKMSLNEGDGQIQILRGEKVKQDPAIGLKHILMLAAGFMAEYMASGELFWESNPKSLLMECPDMTVLKAFNFEKISTKAETRKLLLDLQTFLSQPEIFGKVMWLADELRDSPKGLDGDIDFLIVKCQRQRTPENDVSPLIDYIVDGLFERKLK